MSRRSALSLVLLSALIAGCAPPTAPLYRDYSRVASTDDAALFGRLAHALGEAGWQVVDTDLPGVVATEEKTVRRWWIYRLTVSLEAAPVGERHVRVFVHPFRRFVTGGQSKLFALDDGLRRSLFPPLDSAFARHGFDVVREP